MNAFKIFGLVGCIALLSCADRTAKEQKDTYLSPEDYEYVHLIPDSLRTPKQQELYELLLKTVVLNLGVEENHLVLKLPEEEFLNAGIPKPYYDLLQHELKNTNRQIDSMGIEGMDGILGESYKDLYVRFKDK